MPQTAASGQAQSMSHVYNISTLRRNRGNIIGQINSLIHFLDEYEASNCRNTFLLQSYLNGLNEVWKRFDEIQFNIEELDESEEGHRFEIQNSYYAAVARAQQLIHDQQSTSPLVRVVNDSPATIVSAPMAIKLPEMRLPTFDGTIEKWAPFFDIFSSIIDRNEDLTPVQKLQYLRSTLTAEAAACIQALSTTDANYADAIELLKEKFDCTRHIILGHCDVLRELPKPSRDSPESLSDLVDAVNQHLRALKNLGENISAWNSLLVSIILSKLNSDTVWHWELTLKDKKKMPAYTDLLIFLERRATCAPTASSRKISSSARTGNGSSDPLRASRHRPSRCQVFLSARTQRSHPYRKRLEPEVAHSSANTRQCPHCGKEHSIWACKDFLGLPIHRRLVRGSCRICNKRHHTLLHHDDPANSQATAGSSNSIETQ